MLTKKLNNYYVLVVTFVPCNSNQTNIMLQDDITVKHCTNAYMLVYIRDSEMSEYSICIGQYVIKKITVPQCHFER